MNMNAVIEEHKEVMRRIHEDFIGKPWSAILEKIRDLLRYEPNDIKAFLLGKEEEVAALHAKYEDVESDRLSVQPEDQEFTEDVKNGDEVKYNVVKRNGMEHRVEKNKKHSTVHSSLLYCIQSNKKFEDLEANDHRIIANCSSSTESSVRVLINRILNERPKGLSRKEKEYYTSWLISNGWFDKIELFPFLQVPPAGLSTTESKIA